MGKVLKKLSKVINLLRSTVKYIITKLKKYATTQILLRLVCPSKLSLLERRALSEKCPRGVTEGAHYLK